MKSITYSNSLTLLFTVFAIFCMAKTGTALPVIQTAQVNQAENVDAGSPVKTVETVEDKQVSHQNFLVVTKYEILVEEAIRFLTKIRQKRWHHTLFGGINDSFTLYEEYGALFSPKALVDLNQYRLACKTEQQKRTVDLLRRLIIKGQAFIIRAGFQQKISHYLETPRELSGDRTISLSNLNIVLADLEDEQERWSLLLAASKKYLPLVEKFEELILEDMEAVKNLNFLSFQELLQAISGENITEWANIARSFLVSSEKLYLRLLQFVSLKEHKKEIDALLLSDFAPLLNSSRFDRFFKHKKLLALAKSMFGRMEFDLKKQDALQIHLFNAPAKSPFPYCVPLFLPTDVRISLIFADGPWTYQQFFFLMGQAQFFMAIDNLQGEFKNFGITPYARLYGQLFQALLENKNWLSHNLALTPFEKTDYLRFAAFKKLYHIRLACARLLFLASTYTSDDDVFALNLQNFKELMEDALKIKFKKKEFVSLLQDLDYIETEIEYLMAAFLEPHLTGFLNYNFGPDWFIHPYTRGYLKNLWHYGSEKSLPDLLGNIRTKQVDYDKFLEGIQDRIQSDF